MTSLASLLCVVLALTAFGSGYVAAGDAFHAGPPPLAYAAMGALYLGLAFGILRESRVCALAAAGLVTLATALAGPSVAGVVACVVLWSAVHATFDLAAANRTAAARQEQARVRPRTRAHTVLGGRRRV